MKVYRGALLLGGGRRVDVITDGRLRQLPWRLDVENRSPTGFGWGYGGSGPAQLALAILCDAVGVARARRLYMLFKDQIIARLDGDAGWQLDLGVVLEWVECAEWREISGEG